MSMWTNPVELLTEELHQRRDEGVDVPKSLTQRIDALDPIADAWREDVVWPLYDELAALPDDPVLAAREPNDLAAIRALRPEGPRDLRWQPPDDELHDRLHGAWTGRAAGCALGKPVELIGIMDRDGRGAIKRYLTNRGDWPLRDYFSGRDAGDGIELWAPRSTREQIAYMEPDDDIHYSLVALGVMEEHGPTFTWDDVARYWMTHIPVSDICTAEVQALLTWMSHTSRLATRAARSSATPELCRRHRNPYREWIGAQIRSDGWAWVCAGKPELAAELAYRDACWTHERNGIYGEMLFAAIQAAAFVEHDPRRLVDIGLSEIPRDCRLAEVVREVAMLCAQTNDWERVAAHVETRTDAMSPPRMNGVHTINNAALCVMALLLGEMDTLDAIGMSVMAGKDTDCNGATVGSIVGAAAGRSGFRAELAAPLHDTIKPNLIGFQEVTMSELARRTAAQWHRVEQYARERSAR